MIINIFSFIFGVFSTIICAIYLFIRFLEILDVKVQKDFNEVLQKNAQERAEMRSDTSRFNSEKRGKIYIKVPDNLTSVSVPDKQYGVLMTNMLFLFTNLNDKSAKSIICFDGCLISIVRNKVGSAKFHKKNAISVEGTRDLLFNSKILHFYFDNGKDLESWYWHFKEAASVTTQKTALEDKQAKLTQKFYQELPTRLHIPADQLEKPIYNLNETLSNHGSTSNTKLNGTANTTQNTTTTTTTTYSGNGIDNNNSISHKRTGSGSNSSPKIFDELPSLRERIKSVTSSIPLSSSPPSNSFINNNNNSNSIDNQLIDNQLHSIIDDLDFKSDKIKKSSPNNTNTTIKTTSIPTNNINNVGLTSSIPSASLVDVKYDWFNVFLARIFFNIYDSPSFLEFASGKITRKLNKLKKPSILKSITLQNLEFGPNLPVLNDAKLVYLTPQGEFSADATISYNGGFTLTIKIEIMISFRNHSVTIPFVISVLVKSLSGRLNIQCLPPPTKRLWIGFYEEPQCEISIDTSIGQSKAGSFTNIPKLAKIIVTKLKAEIFEMIVLPNMDDIPLPHPGSKKKTDTTTTTTTTIPTPITNISPVTNINNNNIPPPVLIP